MARHLPRSFLSLISSAPSPISQNRSFFPEDSAMTNTISLTCGPALCLTCCAMGLQLIEWLSFTMLKQVWRTWSFSYLKKRFDLQLSNRPNIYYRQQSREIIKLVGSVCVFVCSRSSGWTIWHATLVWGSTLTLAKMGLWVKVVGQRSRSNAKISFWTFMFVAIYLLWDQGQRSVSRSKVKITGEFEGQDQIMARSDRY